HETRERVPKQTSDIRNQTSEKAVSGQQQRCGKQRWYPGQESHLDLPPSPRSCLCRSVLVGASAGQATVGESDADLLHHRGEIKLVRAAGIEPAVSASRTR